MPSLLLVPFRQHPSSFPSEASRRAYLRAWVANYEVSDALRSYGEEDRCALFLRFNEWPERGSATHEEKERLKEMMPFGGSRRGDKSDAVVFDSAAGETMFVVEVFTPVRELLTPAKWLALPPQAEHQLQPLQQVVVLDLNGHFAVGLPEMARGGPEPTFTMLNTTPASYIEGSGGLAAAEAFDLFFLRTRAAGEAGSVAAASEVQVANAPHGERGRPTKEGIETEAGDHKEGPGLVAKVAGT